MNEHNQSIPSLKAGEAAESAAPPSLLRVAAMMLRHLNQGLDPMTHAGGLLEALCLKIGIQNAWLLDLRHAPSLCVARFPEIQCSNLPQALPSPDPGQRRSSGSQSVFALRAQGGLALGQLLLEGTIPAEPSEELDLALATLESAFAWKKPEADEIGPLRRAFENSEDGFWEWDLLSGKVIFSDRDAEMLGYTQEEIPNRMEDCALLYHPEDLARGRQLLAQHAEGKIPLVDTRLRLRHKNGSWVWVRTRAKIVERDSKTGEPTRVVGADTDISEQKAMEEELEKLAFVVRNTTNIVVIADTDFRVEWVNEGFVRQTGYSLEELRGTPALEIGSGPMISRELTEPIFQTLSRGEVFSADVAGHRKDGSVYHSSVECRPIYNGEGKLGGYVAIGQDITERKRAEQALAESEERLRLVVECTQDAIWDWDIKSGESIVSSRMGAILGEVEEERRVHWSEWLERAHPGDVGEALKSLRLDAPGGVSSLDIKYRMRHRDGHWVWIRSRLRVVSRDTEGRPLRIVGANTDITHEKLLEGELEKLAMVVRGTSNVVVLRDRNFCVEWVNDAFVRMTGYTLEEVRGKVGLLLVEDPKGDAHAIQRLEERLIWGERVEAELSLRNKQGQRRWVSIEAGPIRGANGEIIGFANIGQDITERVLAEEERSKMEERVMISQRLESVGLLAGGIAHDFNNLLMGVLLEAGAAREELPEHSPVAESLATIEISAKRMAELVNQLLAYAGRGRFVVEKVDPNAVVKDTLSLIARNIDRQAELVAEIEKEKTVIEIDPSQLRQVVMNLVINASDALGGQRGRVGVRTECAGGLWTLTVEDSGQGMSEEVRSRVFDPFFTTKKRGRGLGLSTVHGVVKRGKGQIEVDSKLGVGSVFRVRFPLLAHAGKKKTEYQD